MSITNKRHLNSKINVIKLDYGLKIYIDFNLYIL